jgi:hypothetical protein
MIQPRKVMFSEISWSLLNIRLSFVLKIVESIISSLDFNSFRCFDPLNSSVDAKIFKIPDDQKIILMMKYGPKKN